ncbi:hypothetical protein BDF22DRAFT_742760 [Syncephalis plumigaleata]|nr:hypothetical protein BDF22DRAFT_742760 [Syncephalis plumigaleata]
MSSIITAIPAVLLLKRLRYYCYGNYFEQYFLDADAALRDLGPWCADYIWHSFYKALRKRSPDEEALKKYTDKLTSEDDRSRLKRAISIISHHRFDLPSIDLNFISPKVMKLLEILTKFITQMPKDGFRGMVFVDRRKYAFSLVKLINKLPTMREIIRCRAMIGSGTSLLGDYKMSFKERQNAVDAFRNGDINLLITTTVGEEGLDIPACNVVIRFSFFDTLRAYIQSRGRARHSQSAYIIMQERGNAEQMKLLRQIRRHEGEMEIWCSQRSTKQQQSGDSDSDDTNDEADPFDTKDLEKYQYIEPSTGARITDTSAISLIYAYCQQLPRDIYCKPTPQWDFNEVSEANFVCNLTLPNNAHIRHVPGEVTRSKARAKRLVAFRACMELHKLGGLTEHLMPIKLNNDKNELAELEAATDDNKAFSGTIKTFPRKIPEIWLPKPLDGAGEWYMQTLVLETSQSNELYRPMVIATRQRLPDGLDGIQLFLDKNVTGTIRLIPWPRPVLLELDMLISGVRFMSTLFHSILRKEFDYQAVGYLLFPLLASANPTVVESCSIKHIDWDQIINAKNPQTSGHSSSLLELLTSRDYVYEEDTLVIDTCKHSQYYEVVNIRHDLSPTCNLAKNRDDEASMITLKQELMKKYKYCVSKTNQPLLEVKWIKSKRFNYLDPVEKPTKHDTEKNPSTIGNYAVPEACRLSPLKASVFRMGSLMPSFLYRLETALLAVEYGRRFDLCTTLPYLSCALTLPTVHVRNNYERLEMLGDSILKIMTSTSLFIEHSADSEAFLHVRRRNIICNRELCKNAIDRNSYAYMISKSFTRKWIPHGFAVKTQTNVLSNNKEIEGEEVEVEEEVEEEEMIDISVADTDEIEEFTIISNDGSVLELNEARVAYYHPLSEKMLADVIEASLGASVASYNEDAALQCAIKMGVPLIGSPSRWSAFKELLPPPPEFPEDTIYTVNVKAVESILGYTFKHSAYLVEAFTHGSAQAPITKCYQRLEYLGDAVLDYLVVDLYYHRYPELDPGGISEIKDATVSNEFLSTICVLLKLHHYLDHFSDPLARDIDEFTARLTERRAKLKDKGEYWRGLKSPKVMGDLVESSLGAIYLDSGFDLDVTRKAFNRLIRPLIDDRIAPGKVNVSPKCRFTKTVQKYGCNLFKFAKNESLVNGMHLAAITVHGHTIMEALGESSKQATIQVASDFLDQWDAGKHEELMEHCDCLAKRLNVKARKEQLAEEKLQEC